MLVARVACFFVKQKTAYEMRISDWSSDVCSSDLQDRDVPGAPDHARRAPRRHAEDGGRALGRAGPCALRRLGAGPRSPLCHRRGRAAWRRRVACRGARSEEHTSELQSLMRISYAVFSLQKKKKNTLTHPST